MNRIVQSTMATMALLAFAGVSDGWAADANVPVSDWTGWHIGAGAGYGLLNHKLDLDVAVDGSGGDGFLADATARGLGGQGGLVTLEAGYDFATEGGWLFGIQADFTLSGMETNVDVRGSGPGEHINGYLRNAHSFSVLGRAGYLVNDATLLYLTAGLTRSRFDADTDGLELLDLPLIDDTVAGFEDGFSAYGVTIGGGVENVIADNVTLKFEHRMTLGRDENLAVFDQDVDGDTHVNAALDAMSATQTIRAVISYRPGVKAAVLDGSQDKWNSVNAGVGLGYGMLNHELDLGIDDLSAQGSGIGADGALASFEVGLDHLIGDRIVVGALASFTYSGVKSEGGLETTEDAGGLDIDATLKASRSFDALARLGLLTGPDVLWYGLAGYTQTRFDLDVSVNSNDSPQDGLSETRSVGGLTFGGGVEVMLRDNLSWKTEYRYTNYDAEDIIDGILEDSVNAQSIRSVISWRF